MQLNETKLANLLGTAKLRPMTPEEITSIGCVAGYASPIGMNSRGVVVIDELVAETANLVVGANEEGWHLRNVNAGRDFQPDYVADSTAVADGQGCVVCGSALRTSGG